MSMPVIRAEVAKMLAHANHEIALAESDLVHAGDRRRVQAAGELAFLKHQKEMLEHRLNEIDSHPGASETVFEWIREEWFNLSLRLESWVAHL